MELAPGVVTKGYFDTVAVLPKVGLPASLEGARCLDVGTCDGFWAFEMERRGAAEVIGIDLDDKTERDFPADVTSERVRSHSTGMQKPNFELAREALGMKAERVPLNVYELSPERIGEFDFCFIGSLLLHLRDPVGALAAIRSVCRGRLVVHDTVSARMTLLNRRVPAATFIGRAENRWWTPNVAALRRFTEAAGFAVKAHGGPHLFPFGEGFPARTRSWRDMRPSQLAFNLVYRPFGVPHAWVLGQAA
jgi:tRNA (mo5U34)-methyltransferase